MSDAILRSSLRLKSLITFRSAIHPLGPRIRPWLGNTHRPPLTDHTHQPPLARQYTPASIDSEIHTGLHWITSGSSCPKLLFYILPTDHWWNHGILTRQYTPISKMRSPHHLILRTPDATRFSMASGFVMHKWIPFGKTEVKWETLNGMYVMHVWCPRGKQ